MNSAAGVAQRGFAEAGQPAVLAVPAGTVETLLGLVQTRSSMRVEWYIVLLIIAELLLTTYPLLLHR